MELKTEARNSREEEIRRLSVNVCPLKRVKMEGNIRKGHSGWSVPQKQKYACGMKELTPVRTVHGVKGSCRRERVRA